MVSNSSNIQGATLHVALDIGTTKVVAMAGKVNQHGKLEVLGTGKAESTGVLRGVVSNIEKTVHAIKQAIRNAEQGSGLKFTKVTVGIAGQHIKSLKHTGMITRDNDHTEISNEDINRLVNDIHKMVLPAGDKILHVVPQEYIVDNEQGIIDPIGMSGIRLDGRFHVITCQSTAASNTNRCLERADLKLTGMMLPGIASAKSILSPEECEAGVALVDFGGGTSDLIVFKDGIIRHTASLALGSNLITNDIREGCNIMQNHAELLKVQYGSAIADEIREPRIIAIPSLAGREPREVNERNLALIIQARMEEIFEFIYGELVRSGYERKLVGGIVLTGGGARLPNIDWLCEAVTGIQTRIGTPQNSLGQGYPESISGPEYSTVIGMILHENELSLRKDATAETQKASEVADAPQAKASEAPVQQTESNFEAEKPARQGGLKGLFSNVRDFFEAEPDRDMD